MVSVDSPNLVRVEVIAADNTRRALSGAFQSFRNRYLTLVADEPIRAALAVSVEYNDILFVGEVLACKGETSDRFRIQIGVEHTLTSLQSLIKLRAELIGTPAIKADRQFECVHI